MRIALLSDIHGNSIALDAVLEDIPQQGGIDAYWVLGDLAAIGHDPVGVLADWETGESVDWENGKLGNWETSQDESGSNDESTSLPTTNVPIYQPTNPPIYQSTSLPTHQSTILRWPACVEIASSFAWTQDQDGRSPRVEWLAELPLEFRTVLPDGTRVLKVHASPGRDDGLSMHPGTSKEELQSMAAESQADLLCVGHTHWPMDLTVDGVHLLNVGSVSNVFPPDLRASYVMLEADESGYHVQHRRVPYDREAVVRELRRAPLGAGPVNHPAAKYIIQYMRGENHPHWRRTRQ